MNLASWKKNEANAQKEEEEKGEILIVIEPFVLFFSEA